MSTLFLCLLASSRRPFRALKMRPVRQVLLLARHASENASRAAGGCPQSVESAVLRAFGDAFDVAGAVLRAFEDASRTREGGFHAPNALSVPETPVFYTKCF